MRWYAVLPATPADGRRRRSRRGYYSAQGRAGPWAQAARARRLVNDGGVSESSAVSPALREVLLRRRRAKPRKPTFETSGEVG